MNSLYIQQNNIPNVDGLNNMLSIEGTAFLEAAQQANWLVNEELWEICSGSIYASYLERGKRGQVIPIGSVEFVQEFLAALRYPELRAVDIPPELNEEEFLHRRIWTHCSKKEAIALQQIEKKPLLVKPAVHPKRFEATTTKYLSEVPNDEPLFVSEMFSVPIVSEWRVFVLRNRIVDLRPYDLTEWVFPDKQLVREMASQLSMPSCAMDVAVLADGKTVLIEVHPFIACGLYGFEGPKLLDMAKVAWAWQINRKE